MTDTSYPAPTRVPDQAIHDLAGMAGGSQPRQARVLLRWHPEDAAAIDWVILLGHGIPEAWYYSPTPVVSMHVRLPDQHDIDQALRDDVDAAAQRATAEAIIRDQVEEASIDLAHQVERQARALAEARAEEAAR